MATSITTDIKPTILIVPGGWHSASVYSHFAAQLESLGYPTTTTSLPSVNSKSPQTATCTEDSKALRKELLALIDTEEKDVVILAHSYGGVPAGGAAHGLSKTTRDGKKGGVLGLIYMSAFVVPEGISLLDYLGGKHAPYCVVDQPSEGLSIASPAKQAFYHDVDSDTADRLASSLLPHATLAYESPAPAQAWQEPAFEGRLGFVRCTVDQALPIFVQDMFVKRSGVKWTVKDMDTSHSPWASKPKELAETVAGLVEAFGGK
ncbi:hypothetical protein G7Y79_00034g069600 [Physcia stellaris]|nr:hypothetical protein G7Y79_00034g069600 [Physcia stellaris]